jgi:hypothetical protein
MQECTIEHIGNVVLLEQIVSTKNFKKNQTNSIAEL